MDGRGLTARHENTCEGRAVPQSKGAAGSGGLLGCGDQGWNGKGKTNHREEQPVAAVSVYCRAPHGRWRRHHLYTVIAQQRRACVRAPGPLLRKGASAQAEDLGGFC